MACLKKSPSSALAPRFEIFVGSQKATVEAIFHGTALFEKYFVHAFGSSAESRILVSATPSTGQQVAARTLRKQCSQETPNGIVNY